MVYTHVIHCIRRKILKFLSNEPWATQAKTRSSCAILASRSPSRSTPGIYMVDTDALMKVHGGCWFIFGIYLYTYHTHCICRIYIWYIHGIFHSYCVLFLMASIYHVKHFWVCSILFYNDIPVIYHVPLPVYTW